MSTNTNELKIPPAPRSEVIRAWLRTISVLCFALTAPIAALIALASLKTSDDSLGLAEQLGATSSCRSNLAAAETTAQGEVSSYGWAALLEVSTSPTRDPERLAELQHGLEVRIEDWKEAKQDRLNAEEICAGEE